jgi:hypothetical protein
VLIGVDDVAPGLGEEAADGGDQAGLIGAGEEQARGGWLAGDRAMIAGFRARSLSSIRIGSRDPRLQSCGSVRTM